LTLAERFAAELKASAGGRSRVDLEDIWTVFTQLRPDDARAVDARQRLVNLIEEAAEGGYLTASVSKDQILPIPLPRFVTVPNDRTSRTTAPRVPWLPQLKWAAQLRLNPLQANMLARVNRWLRDGGEERPIVPAEERSIELFDDEKAIANRIGGATTFWQPGRLDSDLLRYENLPIPFPYRQVGTGSRVLMVENTAAFRTCSRLLALEESHPYFAVAFGQGAWAPNTIPAALEFPGPIRAIDYWGDLDVNGLAIARDVVLAAAGVGLIAGTHATLWRLMLAHDPVPHSKAARNYDAFLVDVLPSDLRVRAGEVIAGRCRIPQERVGYEELSSSKRWWDPESDSR
jgi:hypothetical protein